MLLLPPDCLKLVLSYIGPGWVTLRQQVALLGSLDVPDVPLLPLRELAALRPVCRALRKLAEADRFWIAQLALQTGFRVCPCTGQSPGQQRQQQEFLLLLPEPAAGQVRERGPRERLALRVCGCPCSDNPQPPDTQQPIARHELQDALSPQVSPAPARQPATDAVALAPASAFMMFARNQARLARDSVVRTMLQEMQTASQLNDAHLQKKIDSWAPLLFWLLVRGLPPPPLFSHPLAPRERVVIVARSATNFLTTRTCSCIFTTRSMSLFRLRHSAWGSLCLASWVESRWTNARTSRSTGARVCGLAAASL